MTTPTLERPKLTELRSEIENHVDKITQLRKGERTDETRSELRKSLDSLGELDTLFRVEQRMQEMDREEADEGRGPRGGTRRSGGDTEQRSFGQQLVESDGYKKFGENRSQQEVEVRTLLNSTGGVTGYTSGSGLFRPVGQAILPPINVQRQRLFIEDVLPTIQTTLASVPYIRELNSQIMASGAAFVAEGGTKPEVEMDFSEYDAPMRKLAAWIPMTYEILQDAPLLRGYVDSRLMYMLMLAVEKGILNGSGSGANLTGIRQTAGLQTYGSGSDTDVFSNIGRSIAKIELVDGNADFVALNPADYWVAATTRNANLFDGGYGAAGAPVVPFGAPPSSIFGLPVVRTRSMPTGKALVGSANAAVILDREQTVIRVGDQHVDYFVTNKVAVLAERRLGLAVHRPEWFVETSYQAASL